MKYLFTLLLFVSLNVFSAPEGYIKLFVTVDGDETFIDTSTIERDGTKRRFWTAVNHATPISEHMSSRNYEEIDCKKKTIQVLSLTLFKEIDLKGAMFLFSGNEEWEKNYIAPRTAADNLKNYVCKL